MIFGDQLGFRITRAHWTGFSTKLQRISLISVSWTRLRDYWSTRISWTDHLYTTRDSLQVRFNIFPFFHFSICFSLILDISVGVQIAAKHNKLNSEDTSIKSRLLFWFKNLNLIFILWPEIQIQQSPTTSDVSLITDIAKRVEFALHKM